MNVLVVEDEWLVRELIVAELLEAGFDVVEAESGEAALARYHNPDVLFTDVRLPGRIDGWDVAERCRASNSDLPVVLRNRLLSHRASPRSRSRLNQQAVHLRPRHRCDQARHEQLLGRAALRVLRRLCHEPRSVWRINFWPLRIGSRERICVSPRWPTRPHDLVQGR
jgi:CheY-like chemotaxis protein